MARFDFYVHPDAVLRKKTPYLLDVQNDHINSIGTRVVIPLRPASQFGPTMRDLNPVFEIKDSRLVLDTAALAAFPSADLKKAAGNLKPQQNEVIGALDTLFGAY